MRETGYSTARAAAYARRWAFGRNPKYANFDGMGGDCTNFISQCIFAGCSVMNYTPDVGWYYISLNERAAAWSSVEYLHRFLITNNGVGPYAMEQELSQAQTGDIIQLSFDGERYAHSLFVLSNSGVIRTASHTFDSLDRSLLTYRYKAARCLRILGARDYD